MTEETQTVEERLARVETKTDRLIKDVEEGRAETRAEFKELREIVEANDKALRNDMKNMESRLVARQEETAGALRDELRAEMQDTAKGLRKEMQNTAKGLRADWKTTEMRLVEQSLKNTELVADTKGQLRMLTLMMIPMVLAAGGYIFKLAFS